MGNTVCMLSTFYAKHSARCCGEMESNKDILTFTESNGRINTKHIFAEISVGRKFKQCSEKR